MNSFLTAENYESVERGDVILRCHPKPLGDFTPKSEATVIACGGDSVLCLSDHSTISKHWLLDGRGEPRYELIKKKEAEVLTDLEKGFPPKSQEEKLAEIETLTQWELMDIKQDIESCLYGCYEQSALEIKERMQQLNAIYYRLGTMGAEIDEPKETSE